MRLLFANIFGFIALLISFYMYQAKDKKILLKRQMLYSLIIIIEFIVLKAYIVVLVSIISFIRSYIFYLYSNKNIPKYYVVILVFLFGLLLCVDNNNYLSFIPIIIAIIYTLTLLIKNVNKIKIICIILSVLWIIYYFIIGAYISIVNRIIDIIAILYSIRKDFKK